jgi:hypothetical protein
MSTITSGISVKITGAHLDRLAIVYVRQSTLVQVRDHGESTQRQYALSDDAERMGWPAERVLVIDADLGVSGRGGSARAGFKELVGRVCCGEVGAVFGLEVSRLARSTADLQRLLELCSLTDTLIIDGDGVYDLGQFNDRMLLGLKGTSLAGCRALAAPLPPAANCGSRCPSATSTTTTATPSWTPTRRSARPSLTCSLALSRPVRPTRSLARSPSAGSPRVPTAARGPGSCATAA